MFNKSLIDNLLMVKSELKKLDKDCLYQQFSPNLPASEENIIEVEKVLVYVINEEYRDFLKSANGWNNFFQTITLYGTCDFLGSELYLYLNQGF